ncbi:alpha/beta fold hydrolase [Sciscionella sediminilitoris]|uniref:alpha/beta fold hydrolase n=1 Tax=Sciscionella sediminilitoris TaxID=1445613 RepID=UPI0004DF40D1|nr:alpha/beta fold hydrolase [Sciscionella sp. SE31]
MRVRTSDGLELEVAVTGAADAPVLLCVHGYPDDKTLWEGTAQRLADRFRVVRFDVRGAGGSDTPASRSGYLLDQLARDIAAVADAVSSAAPVHLLAHDWGSIQAWHAVTEPEFAGRFASFTSISGPCLDHVGHWMRETWRHKGIRGIRAGANQLLHSWYIGFFQLPVIPELAWRSGVAGRAIGWLERRNGEVPNPRTADAVHGLELYRANMRTRLRRPAERRTRVPVQVLAPDKDSYVTAPMQAAAARWAPDFTKRRVHGGHWLPRSEPGVVAEAVAEFTGARTAA